MFQFSITHDLLRLVSCSAVVLWLTGCGQKGDLYLPDEAVQLLNIIVF
ncbi:MAG: lipoprotein [Gammaproteobacteria bacterium]|nr:lipoprotein [Gammaproteobacteria bacterium]